VDVSVKRVCCAGFAMMAMCSIAQAASIALLQSSRSAGVAVLAQGEEITWTYRIENHPADVVATSSTEGGEMLDTAAVVSVSTESWSLDSIIADIKRSAATCLNTFRRGLGLVFR